MKAAIFNKYGDISVLKTTEITYPKLSKNRVIVKVTAAALNPKDILIRKGKFKRFSGNRFPKGIGFDFAGIIEDPNHSPFKKGTKVFGMLNGWKGRTCAEYIAVPSHELYPMPENISFEEAAGIPLAGQTALQAIRNLGQLKKGQHILINGASGGVGTLAIQIAKALGAKVTSISSSKNLAFCKEIGADHTIAYDQDNVLQMEQHYDVFFDVFGNYTFKKVSPILTTKGRYISTVPKPAIIKAMLFNFFNHKKAKLVVVRSNKEDLQWLHQKVSAGLIKPLVEAIFTINDIQEAQKQVESKRSKGKVIIKIS